MYYSKNSNKYNHNAEIALLHFSQLLILQESRFITFSSDFICLPLQNCHAAINIIMDQGGIS